MPRKKARQAAAKRPRPALPDGDEGRNLTIRQRQEKLEPLLKDFDQKVAGYMDLMLVRRKRVLDDFRRAYQRNLVLFKPILDKPISDFMTTGEDKEVPAEGATEDDIESEINSKYMAASRRPRRGGVIMTTIDENEENQPPSTMKKSGRKPASVMLPPVPTTGRRTRRTVPKNKFTTPGNSSFSSVADTPLITPRFNPKLPKTPWSRRKKPREQTLCQHMSTAGSPIELSQDEVVLCMGNKAFAQEDMDVETREHLRQLFEQLRKMNHQLS